MSSRSSSSDVWEGAIALSKLASSDSSEVLPLIRSPAAAWSPVLGRGDWDPSPIPLSALVLGQDELPSLPPWSSPTLGALPRPLSDQTPAFWSPAPGHDDWEQPALDWDLLSLPPSPQPQPPFTSCPPVREEECDPLSLLSPLMLVDTLPPPSESLALDQAGCDPLSLLSQLILVDGMLPQPSSASSPQPPSVYWPPALGQDGFDPSLFSPPQPFWPPGGTLPPSTSWPPTLSPPSASWPPTLDTSSTSSWMASTLGDGCGDPLSLMSPLLEEQSRPPSASWPPALDQSSTVPQSPTLTPPATPASCLPLRPRHPCTIQGCLKTYARRYSLRVHLETHYSALRCRACGKGFTRNQELRRHIASLHTLQRDFKCQCCFRSFARRDYLTR